MNLGEGYRKSWLGVDTHTHKNVEFLVEELFFLDLDFFKRSVVGGRWWSLISLQKQHKTLFFCRTFWYEKVHNDKNEDS